MLLRIDNIFFNTPDVQNLATFYSQFLALPIRRTQVENDITMWMEINVGGMELSFRKHEGTSEIHPELKNSFLEIGPGNGGTLSFEVDNIENTIYDLKQKGVKFITDVIHCTEGQELISIFKDPFDKPVQLYEARFQSRDALQASGRAGSAFADHVQNLVTSNIRNLQGLALSASMQVPDLHVAREFYAGTLGLAVAEETDEKLVFDVDGAKIEMRGTPDSKQLHNAGINVAVEVLNLEKAIDKLDQAKIRPEVFSPSFAFLEKEHKDGRRAPNRGILTDPEGNKIELWEKLN